MNDVEPVSATPPVSSSPLSDSLLVSRLESLDETARTLSAVLTQVEANQLLLLTLQGVAKEHTTALSLSSTKAELVAEVKRQTRARARDKRRNQVLVGTCTLVLAILLGGLAFTFQQFKTARHDANVSYSQMARDVCQQRSVTWDAMQTYIRTQRAILVADMTTDPALKPKRLAAYDQMLKSFPDVDCAQLGTGLASTVPPLPTGLGFSSNLASVKP
jgi:hypothetical protein